MSLLSVGVAGAQRMRARDNQGAGYQPGPPPTPATGVIWDANLAAATPPDMTGSALGLDRPYFPGAPANAFFPASYGGVLRTDSIQSVAQASLPGQGQAFTPTGNGIRFDLGPYRQNAGSELADGDVHISNFGFSNEYHAHRAEVYARRASPSSTAPANWPDPPGTIRWYELAYYLSPSQWTFSPSLWLTLTQIKGLDRGSPPVAIELDDNALLLVVRADDNALTSYPLGTVTTGTWFVVHLGLKLSPDPAIGTVECWRDNVQQLVQTTRNTMQYKTQGNPNSGPDPVYLKAGNYSTGGWTDRHVHWMGEPIIAHTRLDLPLAA